MKKFFSMVLAMVFAAAIGFAAEQAVKGSGKAGVKRCEERFTALDTDKDGKVSLAEFTAEKHPGGKAENIFKSKDADNDGFLTKDEFCSKQMKHMKNMGKK